MPPRATCDQLVQLYLRTFESVFRILHIPSFQRDYQAYWANPLGVTDAFRRKLLLVMAIGTCFFGEPDEHDRNLRFLASKWIFDAQRWLMHIFEVSEVDIDALQVSCLLLLARQTDVVCSELEWISADFPLRMAISLGLHKEPSVHFPEMPLLEAEVRKRLWATILELSVHSALNSGMPLLITCDNFDCQPPGNFDDVQLVEGFDDHVSSQPLETFTQSSMQIVLMRTIRLRLKIVQSLNVLTPTLTYHEALRLGAELESACRSDCTLIQSYLSEPTADRAKPTDFHMKLFNVLTRRFLLALHGPFAAKAKADLSFYFSYKAVTETSLLLLTYLPSLQRERQSTPENDYSCLMVFVGNTFKHVLWHATANLCMELIDDVTEGPFPPIHSFSRNKFYQAIQDSIETLGRRIRAGDTMVEPYVLFSCSLAQIDATQAGRPVENGITDAAKNSLNFCCRILEAHSREGAQEDLIGLPTSPEAGFQIDNGDLASWELMVNETIPL